MTYEILVVEDKSTYFQKYQEALVDEELASEFSLVNVQNKYDAVKVLNEKNNFVAAIMDLRIPEDEADQETDEANGTALLEETLSTGELPIIVVSATANNLDLSSPNFPTNLKSITRGATCYSEAIEHLNSLRGLFEILDQFKSARADLQKDFTNTFWDLSTHWETLERKFIVSDRVPEVMKRHISNYLVEKWTADEDRGKLHYSEFYLSPSLRERLHTGDIVRYAERNWIIVTPPCDLSNDSSPEQLTLLECVGMQNRDDITKILQPHIDDQSNVKKQKATEKLRKLFTEPHTAKHFLPDWNDKFSCHFIEFKNIRTLSFADHEASLKKDRIVTISSHFIPCIMQRYGAYVSRLGQPEVHTEDYLNYLLETFSVLDNNT